MICSRNSVVRSARLTAGVLLVAAVLGGCAGVAPQSELLSENWPADLPQRAELTKVPFFPQQDFQCGPAALATSMASFNVKVTPEQLTDEVYLPARKGTFQVEMLASPRRHGLVSYQLAPSYEDLLREVASGTPVVVLQNLDADWHYAVVIGYDAADKKMLLRSGFEERLEMPFFVLEYTWQNAAHWAMVTVPPDRIPVTATEASYVAAIVAMARVGEPRAVQTAYKTFLQRWPDNLTASIGLANSYYALGQLSEAEAILRRAAERHPESDAVMNNLAQALSDDGRDDEALSLIQRAVEIDGAYAQIARQTLTIIEQRRAKR
ncbi:MAG: hypothetical protein JWN94_1563 [Betaproteobacteria bacterium]|nr:hypothetical protein [Betaproteobacteria bacterium]